VKSLPAGFQAHLDSGITTLCWCWKLSDNAGRVFGFTDHDLDLTIGSVNYEAASGFTGSQIDSSLGLSVDNLDAAGALSSETLTEDDLAAGIFDNAKVEIWRVNWADTSQRVLMRKGNLGEVSRSNHSFTAEIRGLAHELNQPKGRLFQNSCDAVVGDPRCGVNINAAAFGAVGTVQEVLDNRQFLVTGLGSFENGWFQRGRVEWETGANQGLAMEVKAHRINGPRTHIDLWQAMSRLVNTGDTFRITAGCDKQFSTCRTKFSNGMNFRGFPHMPGNDFAISYPNRDDTTNDGSSLGFTKNDIA